MQSVALSGVIFGCGFERQLSRVGVQDEIIVAPADVIICHRSIYCAATSSLQFYKCGSEIAAASGVDGDGSFTIVEIELVNICNSWISVYGPEDSGELWAAGPVIITLNVGEQVFFAGAGIGSAAFAHPDIRIIVSVSSLDICTLFPGSCLVKFTGALGIGCTASSVI